MYSQDGKLVYAGPTSSIKTKYISLHNHVIAEVGGAGTIYNHTDALGSPVARTNSAAGLISRTRYEPYGGTAAGTQPTMGFTGHVNDYDTGLTYMQQRYYDPVAGRFLSIDPVTTDANTGSSFNRYAYAANNPYRYIDPDGRDPEAANVVQVTGKRPRTDPFVSPVRSQWAPPEFPEPFVNFAAGLGGALLLGSGGELREIFDVDGGVDECSDPYMAGEVTAIVAGAARLAYATSAKVISVAAVSGAAASAGRSTLKTVFRAGVGKKWRPPNLAGKTDAQLRASAGRTNVGMNSYGAGVTAGAAIGIISCSGAAQ